MAATTITEFQAMPCSRCAGSGRMAQFQHRNGGECFRCGATGVDPVMRQVEREMTDDEVISTLAQHGFEVQPFDEDGEDGFMGLFLSDEQAARRDAAMQGARMMLAAI